MTTPLTPINAARAAVVQAVRLHDLERTRRALHELEAAAAWYAVRRVGLVALLLLPIAVGIGFALGSGLPLNQ